MTTDKTETTGEAEAQRVTEALRLETLRANWVPTVGVNVDCEGLLVMFRFEDDPFTDDQRSLVVEAYMGDYLQDGGDVPFAQVKHTYAVREGHDDKVEAIEQMFLREVVDARVAYGFLEKIAKIAGHETSVDSEKAIAWFELATDIERMAGLAEERGLVAEIEGRDDELDEVISGLEKKAKELYEAMVRDDPVRSNRYPSWGELSDDDAEEWGQQALDAMTDEERDVE